MNHNGCLILDYVPYEIFMKKPMPTWGGDLSVIDFQNIYYYAKASEKTEKNWDDVPEDVKKYF